MILQALYDYYQRKASDEGSNIAPFGMEWKEIPFVVVIDRDGNFIRLEERSEGSGNDKRIDRFLVPRSEGKSSNIVANKFYEKNSYAFGITYSDKNRSEKCHKAFLQKINDFCTLFPNNQQFRAVATFYSNVEAVKSDSLWQEMTKKDATNISFRVVDESALVAEHPDLRPKSTIEEDAKMGVCLITGEKAPIVKVHTGHNIFGGGNSKIVSFQTRSSCDSYYKEQGFNAPVSIDAESAYSTALKVLLDKDSPNKFRLGGIQFLFWAQRQCEFENDFSIFFTFPPKDDPDANVIAIRNFMKAPYKGKLSEQEQTQFYLLGLSSSKGRISVRVWREGTVKDFADNIRQHFEDLKMVRGVKDEREYFSLPNLLAQVAFQYKVDNLPPNIVGDVLKSILDGTPYPVTLQLHCMNRIRADCSISYIRAAILKACLNRKSRFNNNSNKPITMALDRDNNNQAYLCGRLFATLEKIQEEANPGINATIRDRYYASAAVTPVAVFSRLMSLKNHHLPKLNTGRAINMERLIGEIMNSMDAGGFPRYLSLDDQSRFAIGYYHQRQDFFTAKDKNNE